jgi:hypothetical protein
MNTAYTKIPLEKLDETRSVLNAQLKLLTFDTGVRYKTRTFYFGKRSGSNRQYTLKSDAIAAKIGIYEENPSYGYRSGSFDLAYYV